MLKKYLEISKENPNSVTSDNADPSYNLNLEHEDNPWRKYSLIYQDDAGIDFNGF